MAAGGLFLRIYLSLEISAHRSRPLLLEASAVSRLMVSARACHEFPTSPLTARSSSPLRRWRNARMCPSRRRLTTSSTRSPNVSQPKALDHRREAESQQQGQGLRRELYGD